MSTHTRDSANPDAGGCDVCGKKNLTNYASSVEALVCEDCFEGFDKPPFSDPNK